MMKKLFTIIIKKNTPPKPCHRQGLFYGGACCFIFAL